MVSIRGRHFSLLRNSGMSSAARQLVHVFRGEQERAMSDTMTSTNNIELAAEIVSAYVSNNSVPTGDLPQLINDVHAALMRVGTGTAVTPAEPPKPAVAVKKSVTNDHIICLEDGKKFKSLKRHLRTQYGLSPEEYREKWGLPSDYPMVAPNYAKARSNLAKQMGLGQQRRRRASK
jgi:MucR family transcriptional regulator, transcriptional regulator of exopolysaccharide biosynthesis